MNLRERLGRAGNRDSEVFYCRIRSRLLKTLARPGDNSTRHADRLATGFGCLSENGAAVSRYEQSWNVL
jgi:hypothetical protein